MVGNVPADTVVGSLVVNDGTSSGALLDSGNPTDQNGMIAARKDIMAITFKPDEEVVQQRREVRTLLIIHLIELFRSVQIRAGEKIGELRLVFPEDMDGKSSGLDDSIMDGDGFLHVKADEWRIQGQADERADRDALDPVFIPQCDDRNHGWDMAHSVAERLGRYVFVMGVFTHENTSLTRLKNERSSLLASSGFGVKESEFRNATSCSRSVSVRRVGVQTWRRTI